jgi:hypothetical protein
MSGQRRLSSSRKSLCSNDFRGLQSGRRENSIHGRDSGGPAVTLKWCSRWCSEGRSTTCATQDVAAGSAVDLAAPSSTRGGAQRRLAWCAASGPPLNTARASRRSGRSPSTWQTASRAGIPTWSRVRPVVQQVQPSRRSPNGARFEFLRRRRVRVPQAAHAAGACGRTPLRRQLSAPYARPIHRHLSAASRRHRRIKRVRARAISHDELRKVAVEGAGWVASL